MTNNHFKVAYLYKKFSSKYELTVILSIWLSIILIAVFVQPWSELLTSFTITIPAGLLLYFLTFNWIFPKALTLKFSLLFYCFCVFVYSSLVFILTAIMFKLNMKNEEFIINMSGIVFICLLLLQSPVQWFVLKKMAKDNNELFSLKKELSQTIANLDFLRYQINPHFLFNALNTVYGLAIQEKAEATGESIAKLGNMMRFLLHENTQSRVPIQKDLNFLNDFIDLHKLRIDKNSTIKIETLITEEVNSNLEIVPMLLVPFVENAFKHGISIKTESFIKIQLEVKNSTLYFNVINSKHDRQNKDIEINSNCIGLNNVKQRLQLLYSQKHQLNITETKNEYDVNLIINLN